MRKRGDGARYLLPGIALLLLLAATSADHTATLSLTPMTVYETTTTALNLTVGNLDSEDVITRVDAAVTGLQITAVKDFKGWTENFTSSSASWSGGTIETNVIAALFQMTARAPSVSANSTQTLTITTTDDTNDQQTQTIQLLVLDDTTGPLFSGQRPMDGDFIAQGTNSYVAQVMATDPETGVDHVLFSYQVCNQGNETQLSLTKSNDTYSRQISLQSYPDGTFLCFEFEGASNGGAATTYSGRLGVDGQAPVVTLSSPANGAMINANAQFTFNASDNLAPTLRCELLIDGSAAANVTVASGSSASFPATNASEGIHSWNVQCTDLAGLTGSGSARTYTLDRTPPSVASTPANGSIIAPGTVITFAVTDNFQLDQVTLTYNGTTTPQGASFSLDTASWPDGPTTVTVTASDQAGNVAAQQLTYTVDRTPPVVALVSPLTTSDVHVDFTFSAYDTYDPSLRCELYVDSVLRKTQDTSNLTTVINDIIAPGQRTWRVECIDDANNRGASANQPVTIVDMSGPDILIGDVAYFTRGSPMVITADITDISGVQSATATLRDPSGNQVNATLSNSGSTWTLTYATDASTPLGTYTATFTAMDTLNNSGSASRGFLLTYAYLVTLTLSPASTQPGSGVTASGTVVKDDGSAVPETAVALGLPGQNVSVPLSGGAYVHAFNAPGDGVYTITASVTSAQNNVTYSASAQLAVSSPGSSSGGDGGGVHGRSVSGGSSGARSSTQASTSSDTSSDEESGDSGGQDGGSGSSSIDEQPGSGAEGDGGTVGVGKATGLFGLGDLDPKLIWAFLILLGILALLAAMRRKDKGDEGKQEPPQDRFGLEDYLEQRGQ